MRWKRFGSRPAKSLTELKAEVAKLKEAEEKTKAYEALQNEKQRIQKEIKKEGFKIKHKKALAIIRRSEEIAGNIGRKTGHGLKVAAKQLKPYAHRYLKKRKSKLSRYI